MLKIYLDNCCYGRPFDDLSQEKNNFDYTKWREDLYEDMSLDELLDSAATYMKNHPELIPKNAKRI